VTTDHGTILVTGVRGQLGAELAVALAAHGRVIALDRAGLDLADPDAIMRVVRSLSPMWIVNAAAYTAVDRAESERDRAFAVNATAPGVLADEAKRCGAVLIHYSTDYVFDGAQRTPYDESATPNPLNAYGASKLEGERAIAGSGAAAIVLRTSWVYGLRGANFLLTIRRLADERDVLRIVDDQAGVPNWSRALAGATSALIARGRSFVSDRAGLYHLSASGQTTWYGLARAIIGDAPTPAVVPISTSEFPTPAVRPAYGVLATNRMRDVFGIAIADWRAVLQSCLASPAEPG
jgi:dTDP-4-dehydrorhamnose reductase